MHFYAIIKNDINIILGIVLMAHAFNRPLELINVILIWVRYGYYTLYILMSLHIVFIIRMNVYYVLLSFNLEVDVFFKQVWFCLAVFFFF